MTSNPGLAWVGDAHRIVLAAEERRAEIFLVLSSAVPLGHQHVSGHGVARTHLLGDDRPETRELHRRIDLMSGDRVMCRLRMVRAASVHRTDQRELVHSLGHFRKQLRDLNSGNVGRDRLEVAVGLRIPGVDVARTAFEPEEDNGVRLAGDRRLPARTRLQPKDIRSVSIQESRASPR